jgi:hypothetical protein
VTAVGIASAQVGGSSTVLVFSARRHLERKGGPACC